MRTFTFFLIGLGSTLFVHAQWAGQASSADITTPITRTGSVSITGTGSYLTLTSRVGGGSNGTILFQNGTSNNLMLAETAVDTWTIGYGAAGGVVPTPIISWNASKTTTFAGNVGIGTTSPTARLHLFNSSSSTYLNIDKPSTSTEGGIQFSRAGNPLFFLFSDDSSDALKIEASGLLGESDATPRMQFPLSNKDIHMALSGGKVGIGTTSPDYPLTVNGSIHAKEVRVDLSVPGPDYVFANDYKLPSLEEIKSYIDENKHLPEVPSAAAMEKNGVQLGEMNMILLKKIEELTLYMIESNRKIESQQIKLEEANKRIESQQQQIAELLNKK